MSLHPQPNSYAIATCVLILVLQFYDASILPSAPCANVLRSNPQEPQLFRCLQSLAKFRVSANPSALMHPLKYGMCTTNVAMHTAQQQVSAVADYRLAQILLTIITH